MCSSSKSPAGPSSRKCGSPNRKFCRWSCPAPRCGRLLGVVREPRFRTCLGLMYHCGLRVGEAVRIEVKDIHGRENPPRLHVKNGKGGKDRYVPISAAMVEELRQWWRTHQNPR